MNIALIGTGNISHKHAQAIARVNDAKLVAIFSHSQKRAEEFAKKYDIEGYSNIDKLLKSDVDILDIVNVNNLHGDFALLGIKAKKHVIIEKPIDVSVEKAKKVIEAAKKNNVKITVISQHRFDKSLRKTKRMIEKGEFGKLVLATVFLGKRRSQEYYDSSNGWRKKKKTAGGGVLMINAIHYISVLRWLFGEVKDVKGIVSKLSHNIEVEDTGSIIMKFNSGVLGVITATNSLESNIPDRIEIYGTKKHVVINSDGKIEDQISNFINHLNKKCELEVKAEDGLEDLKILKKVYG